MAKPSEILIQRGSTFEMEVFWANDGDITRKAITAISLATGAPRLTIANHGIPDGWPAAVIKAGGMKQINAENSPPRGKDFHTVKVIDTNTIEFNDMDSTGFSAYTTGGFVWFKTPVNFAGYTARMDIKDKIGGTVLATTDVADTPLDIITITQTPAESKLVVTINAVNTAGIAWSKGVTDLEMVSPLGVVTKLKLTSSGSDEEPDPVRVVGEVTT